ncbi:hypothetical protein [Aurantibacillus circumpalustris]|uniref:hypothetical protein n=1 Tax=Aurantibacillus circumpalustris TaxID=3036359 RepID=UPI00295A6F8B|nr:hypothetical protein [Aurantibacillus circumpalustris]
MKSENAENNTVIQGKLIARSFGKFSKKDNIAFYLKSKGRTYFLMFKGEEPFNCEKLKKLKNKVVLIKGKIYKYIFFANSVTVLSSN